MRFAVRNSGATAVVEGVGLHACEYMTRGTVLVLGETSGNVGAGMTGGVLYLRSPQSRNLNTAYVRAEALSSKDAPILEDLMRRHAESTGSQTAREWLQDTARWSEHFVRVVPNPR